MLEKSGIIKLNLTVFYFGRSTSNETVAGNMTDVMTYWRQSYPLLTTAELDMLENVYDPAQFSSEDEWMRTATGESMLRCGVSRYAFAMRVDVPLTPMNVRVSQRETVGYAGVRYSKAWAYRYNQPNPTQGEPGITEHAAENWMMFLGTNTG